VRDVSLLGPDDFDLDRKKRAKKLAQDLTPALREQIEKWLEEPDEQQALQGLTSLVGKEEARRLMRLRGKARRLHD